MEAGAGCGARQDVENLESEMRNVQMVLAAAEGRTIDNKPLAWSLDELKELLYDAEDVMDELDYYRLQQQIEQVVSWCSRDRKRKRDDDPTHSTMLPHEIKLDISESIKGIVNHLHKLGNSVRKVLQLEISRLVPVAKQGQYVARNTRLTTSVPIEDKVYGRDVERDKIIELLINGKSNDLHVLPIVGIGGVGKTTLARFVYGDQRIKEHFDLRMWVCVSTNFDTMRLTREILEHDILLKNIENKRFLLVFDDMWEENDRGGWISLNYSRPSVAKMIGTMDPVQVNGLDEKEFWQFFKACAFGNESHEGHPTLQSIGQQIVKSLKGIPLAARSVGALLNRNVTYEHWRTVQNKWKSLQEDIDGILPMLKLSYDFLPVHLQQCFKYCSLFPEDYRFNGENLVRAWISQNFVQCQDPTKRLEETGMQYLDNLVDFGFFQKVDSDYVMHDLMHELAQKASLNECAAINGSNSRVIQPSVRHLSIITTAYDKDGHCSIPCDKFQNILENIGFSKKLRTLMVFGRSSIHLLSMNNLINLRNIVAHEKVHSEIAGVGKLTALQGIKFKVRIVGEFEIKQLRSMNKLVTLEISQLENVKTKEQASGARLIDKEYLQELSLSWNDISVGLDPCSARRTEDVLEGLQPHENLKSLHISGYSGANLPTWLASNVSVKMLRILHLEKCREWQILRLEMLPFLRKLKLIRMWKLTEISIPSLEELILIEMPILEKCLGTYGKELTSDLRQLGNPSTGRSEGTWRAEVSGPASCERVVSSFSGEVGVDKNAKPGKMQWADGSSIFTFTRKAGGVSI
ncbi:unnamed protein product [Miscanthus lutarioriparius]|uniref:Uncharacterized protein n=1 Tax=Miscanthus lutarioriparius TaxID=422564 RepID=A0A811QJ63_9POAL|nr:unnamed protein product [Miscanthus lutarioriparius]